MKAFVIWFAALAFAGPTFGQTIAATAERPPRPAKAAAKSATAKASVPPVEATLSAINGILKTAYTGYSHYWNVAFHYQDGKLVFAYDTANETGYAQHNTFAGNIPQLSEARYHALSDGTFEVRIYCKWRLGCWNTSWTSVQQPDGQPQTGSSNSGSLSMLVAANEDKAKNITKAMNDLIKSADALSGAQKPPQYQGFIVPLQEAANSFHANISRNYYDANPQDAKNISNTTVRYESGHVILEFDEGRPTGVKHVVQTANANDLELIDFQWKEGVGFVANLQCKLDAQCNTTIYVGPNGILGTARYNSVGPFVSPARNKDDNQQLNTAITALDGFVRAAMIEDANHSGSAMSAEKTGAQIDAIMAKDFPQPPRNVKKASFHFENGQLTLQWDAVTEDGGVRHEVQKANANDMDFALGNVLTLPNTSGYYLNLYCKAGAYCNEMTFSTPNGNGFPTKFDHFGPFVVTSSNNNFDSAKPMVDALNDLIETAGRSAKSENATESRPEATVAYINSLRMEKEFFNAKAISNVALHFKNGLVSLEEDRSFTSSGYAAHEEWTANPQELSKVTLIGPFGDSGYVINAYCKTNDPCVTRTQKVTALPENLVAGVAPDHFNYFGWLVARDEETAQNMVKQLDKFLKTAPASSELGQGGQKKSGAVAQAGMTGPSLDETLAYISSQLTGSYSYEGVVYSNHAVRYENGRLVLENDFSIPAQGVTKHASQTVNVRDLDQVWYTFHKNVGYTLWITCKNGMQCIEGSQQTTAMPEGYTPNDGPYKNDHIGWFVVQDVEIAGRMARAADHLIKIATVQNEQADPFK